MSCRFTTLKRWGGRQHYEITDQATYDSLTTLHYQGMNNVVMKGLRWFKRALTTGVTVNPAFWAVRNPWRDSLQSIALAKVGFNPIKNFATGLTEIRKETLMYARLKTAGATFEFGNIYGVDPEQFRDQLDDIVGQNTVLKPGNTVAWKSLGNAMRLQQNKWVGKLMAISNATENANRVNIARSLFINEGPKKGNLREAAFAGRDILDFGLVGTSTIIRVLAQTNSFFNARLQGIYRGGRAFATKEDRHRFNAVVGTYAMASVAVYLAFKNRDEYKELEDWEKDTYHHMWFGDQHFRFPKPFEMGAVATIAERAVDTWVNDESNAALFWQRVGFVISEQLNLGVTSNYMIGLMPQAVQPGLEVWANRDTFTDRSIESASMQALMKPERRRAWTTHTARGISKLTPLSPVQVDHLVSSYFSGLGRMVFSMSDGLYKLFADTPETPAWGVVDVPILSSLYRGTGPTRSTKYAREFYDTLTEMDSLWGSIRELRRIGDDERALRLAKEGQQLTQYRTAYRRVQRRLQKIRRRMTSVYANKALSSRQKRNEIDRLQFLRNRITQDIFRTYGKTLK